MSTSLQAIQYPRVQSGFQTPSTFRLQGVPRPTAPPSTSETAIVHIVCDDTVRVGNLREFFSSHSIDVNSFRTAAEYMTNAGFDQTACVVLDLNLPDLSGLEVQTTLTDKHGPPVLFVAENGDLNSGVRAMKNGAIDFILEPIDYKRLLAAVRIAFVKGRNNRRERVERLSLLKRWKSLTPREQDVFQFTVAGFLNKQAAGELGITENTFQVHRGRVMRKMKADSLAELVRMSTRLEAIAQSWKGTEDSTQSLKSILKHLVEMELTIPIASTKTPRSRIGMNSSPNFGHYARIGYSEISRA